MKESDKVLEEFIDKVMKKEDLESPSIDFTSKVMSQIMIAKESKVLRYTPLISVTTWGVLIVLMALLFVYKGGSSSEIGHLYTAYFSNVFSEIHFSSKTVYAILIVPIMVLVQVSLLKSYYDKKYQF